MRLTFQPNPLVSTLLVLPVITLVNGYAHYAEHQDRDSHDPSDFGHFISVEGEHRFVPPGDNDLRGPCPALNAMANHGYLSHDGITTMEEVTAAAQYVFGFEQGLAASIAARGVLYAGNPKTNTFSIGGAPPPAAEDSGLLRRPAGGLISTHNILESDASLLKGDADINCGNNFDTRTDYFQELLTIAGSTLENEVDFADFELFKKLRLLRLQQSKQENPKFWWGPFEIFISEAGTFFVPAAFSNHTQEHPNGTLPLEVLKSFYGIHDDANGKPVARHGWEQIPENWYGPKNSTILASDFLPFEGDFIAASPEVGQIGGNTGEYNSFVPIDIGELTGGVYNLTSLTTAFGLACFLSETARWLAPAVLEELYLDTAPGTKILNTYVVSPPSMGCPVIEKLDMEVFEKYPGISHGRFL